MRFNRDYDIPFAVRSTCGAVIVLVFGLIVFNCPSIIDALHRSATAKWFFLRNSHRKRDTMSNRSARRRFKVYVLKRRFCVYFFSYAVRYAIHITYIHYTYISLYPDTGRTHRSLPLCNITKTGKKRLKKKPFTFDTTRIFFFFFFMSAVVIIVVATRFKLLYKQSWKKKNN